MGSTPTGFYTPQLLLACIILTTITIIIIIKAQYAEGGGGDPKEIRVWKLVQKKGYTPTSEFESWCRKSGAPTSAFGSWCRCRKSGAPTSAFGSWCRKRCTHQLPRFMYIANANPVDTLPDLLHLIANIQLGVRVIYPGGGIPLWVRNTSPTR